MPELISKTQRRGSQRQLTGSLPSHLIFADLHREQAATGRLTLSKGVSKPMGDRDLRLWLEWLLRMVSQDMFRLAAYTYGI
jgi:hypothetical protein